MKPESNLNLTWEGSISEGGALVWKMLESLHELKWTIRIIVRDGEDTWESDCFISDLSPEYEGEGGVVVDLLSAPDCQPTGEQHWVNVYNIASIYAY